jgi:hypothetical protein
MNAQKQPVSLRLLDWLVTNYAKERDVFYRLRRIDGAVVSREPFNVYTDYRSRLSSNRKANFDPFRRGARFYFDGKQERPEWAEKHAEIESRVNELRAASPSADGGTEELEKLTEELVNIDAMLTTVGQLNFFRWAISRCVFDWASRNRRDIEADMARKSASNRRVQQQQKQQQVPPDESPLVLAHGETSERVHRLMMHSLRRATDPKAIKKTRRPSAKSGDAPCRPLSSSTNGSCIVFNVGTHLSFSNYGAPKPF